MLEKLADRIRRAREGVVLTGAGISAESGVPTFRGKEGLWGKFKPEELATMEAFMANPKIVWEWYNWRRELMGKVKPNSGHYALAELGEWFEQYTVVTQNVDGLHRAAGSPRVLELHGNIYRNKCSECNHLTPDDLEIDPTHIPTCTRCGGKIRPDVVWFGELLPEGTIEEAFAVSERADIFFSVGTSALVHPAASLPVIARQHGAVLVEINPEETPLTEFADYSFRARSGELLPELIGLLRRKGGC
ncbi:NAD-dependent protein deacylase [candidate division GN15 bacterium]|uniref:NAD-dependent protein deacylase n=1 Tax=candidate division GN15 bacterium TaxID=2072418 RepID=A0A855WXD0_9BACT|nr:MAG: NAD-dependent protein deacylase [candidate division GN15 bacterium]